MSPVKKRKVAAAAAQLMDVDDNLSSSSSSTAEGDVEIAKLLQQHVKTVATLRQNVSNLTQSSATNSTVDEQLLSSSLVALATLKFLQRQLAQASEARTFTSNEQRAETERLSLALDNVTYERNYLQDEISNVRTWKSIFLEGMAMNELGLDTSSALFSEEEIINTYLFGNTNNEGRSYQDPNEYEYIINKIRTDLGERTILVEKLTKSKLDLKKLLLKRNELRNMLDQLPNMLQELQKAGESLNSFFDTATSAAASGGGDGDVLSNDNALDANSLVCRTSITRSARFDLARSNLPSPLYVLFVQLQGYIDAWSTIEKLGGKGEESITQHGLVGVAGMDVSVSEIQDTWKVVLTLIPSTIIPSVVSSILLGGKATPPHVAVRIVFSFDVEWGVVRAYTEGEDGEPDRTFHGLLDHLFPGDDGLVNPNVSLSFLNQNNDDDDDITSDDEDGEKKVVDDHAVVVTTTVDSNDKNSTVGKPYYWCQMLGGLDFPPPPVRSEEKVPPIQTCTKAVFRQVLRRIRGRMTLMSILDYLSKKSNLYGELPLHPAMKKGPSDNDGGGANNVRQSNRAMSAKLNSWAEFSKTTASSTKGYTAIIKRKSVILKASVVIDMYNYPTEPPVWSLLKNNEDGVFDTALHKIECQVNEEMKEHVNQDVEDTYDWILIHQLADIVSCWDEVMRMKDEGRG